MSDLTDSKIQIIDAPQAANSKNSLLERVFSSRNNKAIALVLYFAIAVALPASILNLLLTMSSGDGVAAIGVLLTLLSAVVWGTLYSALLCWRKSRPEFVFLITAAPLLAGFALLMIPGGAPDEIWHAYRAMDIMHSGNFDMVAPVGTEPDKMPQNYGDLAAVIGGSTNYSDSFVVGRDMSSYLFQLYALPSLVFLLLKPFGVNVFVLMFCGRLVNAAFFLILGYWSIKKIPFGKLFIVVYLLNPMILQQEASLSADAFLNAVAVFYIALLFEMLLQQEKIRPGQAVGLGVVILLLCASKYAYAPMAFLSLILLARMTNKRRALIIGVISVVVIVGGAVSVVAFSSGGSFSDSFNLMKNPLECTKVIVKTFYVFGSGWLVQFAGGSLGWLCIGTWLPLSVLFYCMLGLAAFESAGCKNAIPASAKIASLAIMIVMTVIVVLSMRSWSLSVHNLSDVIDGVQGRYFIPFALLTVVLLGHRAKVSFGENGNAKFAVCALVISAISLLFVVKFFL